MALLQAAIAGLIALIIAPGFLFYFDVTPKLVVLLAGTALVLLFGPGRGAPLPRSFRWLLCGAAASLVLSSCLSTNPALSWFGTNWRRFGAVEQSAVFLFAWLVAVTAAGKPNRTRTILRGIAVAAGLTGLYGIFQYFGIDPFLPAAGYHIGEGIWTIVRPPGTLGYVSYFANWLAMAAFLSLALGRTEQRPLLRVAAYGAAAVAAFAMLLTGTRGAMLGAAAGCGVLLWTREMKLTRRALTIVAALAVAAVLFYISPAGWNLHSRARWFFEDPRGGARLELWRDSFGMALHHPAAGFGPEVFMAQFPKYESQQLAEAYPDFAHESPHNMFLDAMVAQGLPGLAIALALCVVALRCARSGWLRAALVAGIVAQQFTALTIPTAVLFYVTVALAVASSAVPRRDAPRIVPVPLHVGAFSARFAAAAALLYLAFRFTAADHSLDLVRRSIDAGNGTAAATYFAAFERQRLPGAGSDLWYSRAMSALAQRTPDKLQRIQITAQAGYAALRATRTAEDPFNAWYHAAALYAGANDASYAESSLRAAIAAHPNWFKPHWALARILQIEGRAAEARTEADLALALDAGKHKEVSESLPVPGPLSLQK